MQYIFLLGYYPPPRKFQQSSERKILILDKSHPLTRFMDVPLLCNSTFLFDIINLTKYDMLWHTLQLFGETRLITYIINAF